MKHKNLKTKMKNDRNEVRIADAVRADYRV